MLKRIFVGTIAILATVSIILFVNSNKKPSLDSFTSCLKEKGVIFYGAFWCPHCQNQKRLFGNSEKLLPYVECSTPDGKDQTPICKEKNVSSYPTWDLPNGERVAGELSIKELSEKTQCNPSKNN